jgi:hypothetical protein
MYSSLFACDAHWTKKLIASWTTNCGSRNETLNNNYFSLKYIKIIFFILKIYSHQNNKIYKKIILNKNKYYFLL